MKELKADADMRNFFNETETKGAIGQLGTPKKYKSSSFRWKRRFLRRSNVCAQNPCRG
jgi:hypothetical protein